MICLWLPTISSNTIQGFDAAKRFHEDLFYFRAYEPKKGYPFFHVAFIFMTHRLGRIIRHRGVDP